MMYLSFVSCKWQKYGEKFLKFCFLFFYVRSKDYIKVQQFIFVKNINMALKLEMAKFEKKNSSFLRVKYEKMMKISCTKFYF